MLCPVSGLLRDEAMTSLQTVAADARFSQQQVRRSDVRLGYSWAPSDRLPHFPCRTAAVSGRRRTFRYYADTKTAFVHPGHSL